MNNELEELFQALDKDLLIKLLDTLIAEQKLDLQDVESAPTAQSFTKEGA